MQLGSSWGTLRSCLMLPWLPAPQPPSLRDPGGCLWNLIPVGNEGNLSWVREHRVWCVISATPTTCTIHTSLLSPHILVLSWLTASGLKGVVQHERPCPAPHNLGNFGKKTRFEGLPGGPASPRVHSVAWLVWQHWAL